MLKKILNWFKADLSKVELYAKLVTHSREAIYFTDYKIDDSITGRFENIILHLFLIINRIASEEGRDSDNVLALQEAFVIDMDRNLREMGVGDMSVGKKMKEMAAGWYGTATIYEAALAAEDAKIQLEKALLENLYRVPENDQNGDGQEQGGDITSLPSAALAAHILDLVTVLNSIPLEDILTCRFDYPVIPALKDKAND